MLHNQFQRSDHQRLQKGIQSLTLELQSRTSTNSSTTTSLRNHNLNWSHEKEELAPDGLQSALERDWTLFPWDSLALVEQVLAQGCKKYGRDNWKQLPVEDHVMHMMEHAIASYQCAQDKSLYLEHLLHVICRAMFAVQLLHEEIRDENDV